MTILQIVELVKEEIPQAGHTQILAELNQVIADFAHETRIYKRTGAITIVTNTVSYTLSTEMTDIDGELITEVYFKDSTGELVDETDTLKYSVINGVIRFYDYYRQPLTSISDDVTTITTVYVAKVTTKTISDTLTEIPSQFHQGLLDGTLARLYKRYSTIERQFPDGSKALTKDLNTAQYNQALYEKCRLAGKRYANEHTGVSMPSEADQF
jgi:hypothetical protein